MTLDVNWKNCPEDFDADSAMTYGLMCNIAGMPVVNKANVGEFWTRINAVETLTGSFRNQWLPEDDKPKPYPLTREEALTLVGMTTNVSSMTEAQFKSHLWKVYKQQVSF